MLPIVAWINVSTRSFHQANSISTDTSLLVSVTTGRPLCPRSTISCPSTQPLFLTGFSIWRTFFPYTPAASARSGLFSIGLIHLSEAELNHMNFCGLDMDCVYIHGSRQAVSPFTHLSRYRSRVSGQIWTLWCIRDVLELVGSQPDSFILADEQFGFQLSIT